MTIQRRTACILALAASVLVSFAVPGPVWKSKRKKKAPKQQEAPVSPYHKLTGRDSLSLTGGGIINVFRQKDDLYFEIPANLFGRQFLVVNRLQQVPKELNEAGVNRGINYESQTVRFEWDRSHATVDIRQQRATPDYPHGSAIAQSVRDNYIDPLIARLKVEAVSPDSLSAIVKVNDLFDGSDNCLNDVFNDINIGTSPVSRLSRILDSRAFPNNVTTTSELTTVVHEGTSKTNVSVVVSSTLSLLPADEMARREEDQRVGYFTTPRMNYSDTQEKVETRNYVTRWRLVPSDTAAYLRGQLVRPVKPIVFYIDPTVPAHLRPYIKRGMLDWNAAFERAGFKDAIEVRDFTDSLRQLGDDMAYSVLTYDASTKANAMGPSVVDPRTGEILEADIIWWHNVQSLIREWIMVQTGAQNPAARTLQLPDSIIGDAVRFVACHEVGHSLGLRHNMIASSAYPTDSLRSRTFTDRVGGTSASIMDYARFNYIYQPGDSLRVNSPHIGPYDLMAIEWGYRWYPHGTDERQCLNDFLRQHSGRLYRYSEAQQRRTAIDPRALSEDLGDDAMRSATLGIANLKRIVPQIVAWTTTGQPGQSYDEASALYSAVIYQWSLYLYHVLANVGGMYINNITVGDGQQSFLFVEASRQRQAVQFLIDNVLSAQPWLFSTPLSHLTYLQRSTPLGVEEQQPAYMLKNEQNYVLWDLLDNARLVRMFENENENGATAFTAAQLMDLLHNHIFRSALRGTNPDLMERNLQKSMVDALITAAAESEGVKINKKLTSGYGPASSASWPGSDLMLGCEAAEQRALSTASRTVEMTSGQVTRNSDALSLKRGEMLRVRRLLRSRLATANSTTRMHYEDIIMRINTALGLHD